MYKYLITSKDFYTCDVEKFCKILANQIEKHQPTHALFRDKENESYGEQAAYFARVCAGYENLKSFIHQDINLAKKLNTTGVHLTSMQFDEIAKAKKMGLEVIISTHTNEEVLQAQVLGADAVTYSPIFVSPDKGEPKGIEELRKIVDESNIRIFALGGIVEKSHVDIIEQTKAYGFASIRYFY